tara:strand:- start:962 stop:1996 length:1035 start_codon:yes stop_codon:yes gene_type:complete
MLSKKNIIKGMSLKKLQGWCNDNNIKKYNAIQIFEWLYRHGIMDAQLMLNIKKDLRQLLYKNFEFKTLNIKRKISSKTQATVKFLFETLDNKFIETVSMIEKNRHTVCISSQIGCTLNCDFCDTGKMGLFRNLSSGEIIDQLIFVRKEIETPITNVVFMGMGEPFYNYENVMDAADIFHHPKGFNLSSSKITISTAGVLPEITKFVNEKRKYNLAISLNASNNINRTQIMPINKKWNIKEIVKSGTLYSNQKNKNIMFEYVLIKDINDSKDNAEELSNLLKGTFSKINLIPYNETKGKYKRPSTESINSFVKILDEKKDRYQVLVRWSKGQDIEAGCGQLATQY